MKQRTGMQSWGKHLASLASAACILLGGNASAQLGALLPLPLPRPVVLDPLLQSVMQSAGPAQPIEAVVTLNPTASLSGSSAWRPATNPARWRTFPRHSAARTYRQAAGTPVPKLH
jgi:hypothetical protein